MMYNTTNLNAKCMRCDKNRSETNGDSRRRNLVTMFNLSQFQYSE